MENKTEQMEKKPMRKEDKTETIVRILQTDIPGKRNVYAGLTKIKGVSFSMSNTICYKLKIDKRKRIQDLDVKELGMISEIVKNPQVPKFMMNRRLDIDTGADKHLRTKSHFRKGGKNKVVGVRKK